jgi:hypothetical protein
MQHPARPMSIDHEYTALYVSPDGETHLRTVEVQLEPSDFAPPSRCGGSHTRRSGAGWPCCRPPNCVG